MAAERTSQKKIIFIFILLAFFFIFIVKVIVLQTVRTDLKLSSDNNAIREVIEFPARGLIFDRKGNILVYNKPIYEVQIIPNQVHSFDTSEFCSIFGMTKKDLVEKLVQAKLYSNYRPYKIVGPIDQRTYILFSEKLHKYQGFNIQTMFERAYNYPVAPHLLGYLTEVDKKVTDTSTYYKMGDYVGATGIEKGYEKYLRGQKGVSYYVVDVLGRIVSDYKEGKYNKKAVAGANIISSIDLELQEYAESLMVNKKGAIVAIEPQTGEILAMVSFPSYDPNMLNISKLKQNYPKLKLDPNFPLFNRAISSGASPPGSTFKVVDAVIALNEGVINTKTILPCNGGYNIGSHIVKCHHAGSLDFYRSISGSCNSYYCEVFNRLIRNKKYDSFEDAYRAWYYQVQKFGIGRRLNIDIPGENGGILASADYFNTYWGISKWGPFTIISLAIGQGEMGVTPLQLANIACIEANKGFYYIPHVVKEISDGYSIDPKYKTKMYVGIDSSYFTPVVDAMEQVIQMGTAASIFLPTLSQCGKTGTAQNPHGDDHSIFIEFAPKNNPKIAIAVYVENAGFGSTVAAPIASLMAEKYITGKVSRTYMEEYIKSINLIDKVQKTKTKTNQH